MKTRVVTENDEQFTGLRVAITGGTSGLGLAFVREFTKRGAMVAFVARNQANVEQVAADNPGSHGIVGDVSKKEEIYPIALQITGELGGLDLLINNASSLGPVPLSLLSDTDCEDLTAALDTNLMAPFRLTKALLGALTATARERGTAIVLNISSDAAVNAYSHWGAYGASKAALHHLSKIWQLEVEPLGVHILSIDPGDMDTPLHALAIPDADPATLKRPENAAIELIAVIKDLWQINGQPENNSQLVDAIL